MFFSVIRFGFVMGLLWDFSDFWVFSLIGIIFILECLVCDEFEGFLGFVFMIGLLKGENGCENVL